MRNRLRTAAIILLIVPVLSCTSYRSYKQASEFEQQKDWDKAVIEYEKALEVDPANLKYRMALQNAKMEASRLHFEKGKQLRSAGQNELAATELELTVKLDPTNQFAAVEYTKAVTAMQEAAQAAQGPTLEQRKKLIGSKARPPELNPASDEPISLSFPRPTPTKDIYRALGNAFGINVLFDQAVKDDDRISIELRDVTSQQALERVMQAANHFYKVLDEKTIIVVPDTPQKRRDYEDLVIQTFYLSNGDAEQVTNVVRTMIEARNVFPLKALNAITIRDTADKVRIAEKIIEANDKARAEVVVQVELLQVDSNKLRDIGLNLSPDAITASPVTTDGKPITSLPIQAIRGLTSGNWSFTIPSAVYSLIKNNTDAQLLARPQLRISEGEDATLHIGQQQPIPVSTLFTPISGTGVSQGPLTSYTYKDIGIKISITPRVHHNREVTLKITIEVSSLAGEVPATSSSPAQPIIADRTISTTIRLKDGETNFLAGLIRQDDSNTQDETPFLSDIPVIGRLFSHSKKTHVATDVILTMTPHIVRIADITDDDMAPMWVGTTNNLTFRGVSPRLESQSGADPFNYPHPPSQNQANQPTSTNPAWYGGTAVPGQPPPPTTTTTPASPIPAPAGPNDPFTKPPGLATPPSTPPASEPPVNPPGATSAQSQSSASVDGGTQPYTWAASPRIAPQPELVSLKPGVEMMWPVIGMDLAGLNTPQVVLHYDPTALDVAAGTVGSAIEFKPENPPVVKIDSVTGTIRVQSSDGNPLHFRSGGDIVTLRVR
ncbi:MAG: secretin N-terminal domain-containing protein, partial [Acidobacteriota bacterium]